MLPDWGVARRPSVGKFVFVDSLIPPNLTCATHAKHRLLHRPDHFSLPHPGENRRRWDGRCLQSGKTRGCIVLWH